MQFVKPLGTTTASKLNFYYIVTINFKKKRKKEKNKDYWLPRILKF